MRVSREVVVVTSSSATATAQHFRALEEIVRDRRGRKYIRRDGSGINTKKDGGQKRARGGMVE